MVKLATDVKLTNRSVAVIVLRETLKRLNGAAAKGREA